MKGWMTLVLVSLTGPALGELPATPGALSAQGADGLGPWVVHHSPEAGITVALPCDPRLSYSHPQDGSGHQTDKVELNCTKILGPSKYATFRLVRMTYPPDRDLARQHYEEYAAYIRSADKTGAMVLLAGEERHVHADYALKHRAVNGILGLIETREKCTWNFIGLDGGSQVQIIMSLPKAMCPSASDPIVTKIASGFFDSILFDER